MSYSGALRRWVFMLSTLALSAAPVLARDDWKPIDPAIISQKAPAVEKDADAEAIFWEVWVRDEIDNVGPFTVLTHYIRIKIFTERGKESQSKIDLPYFGDDKIKDIAGRTIKPDGTIIDLKKDAVFERTIVKAEGLKFKAKSFAMPGVEVGSVIEYRWREVRPAHLAVYMRLEFQREIPVQLVKYYLKPLSDIPFGMRSITFNGRSTPFIKEKDGFHSTTMTNVPAFREEPRMPPENQVRPWMLIFYSEDKKLAPDRFWKEYGKEQYESYKPRMKPNDEVKKTAITVIGDATTPEQKLERLFEFCRSKIKNINSGAWDFNNADRARFKENKSPGDTLKQGVGTGEDIDLLFAALATAVGFDARMTRSGDRGRSFFDPSLADAYFLDVYSVAVRVGEQWRFFDPASIYVPYGMLRWQEEGLDVLITDPKDPQFVRTPLSPSDKSIQKRSATLRLSEDGTIEGDVRIEYHGHSSVERKANNDEDSAQQREETLRDAMTGRMSTAELSNIAIENVTDPTKPFVYSYHIRVPGYAQRTGKRLFLQPVFFQKGIDPLFRTAERTHSIYFRYPWSEEDVVTIEVPQGFALDNADAPAPFNAGDVCKYYVKIRVVEGKVIDCQRKFAFDGLLFPASAYPQLKNVFDELHKRDNHTITLKQQ